MTRIYLDYAASTPVDPQVLHAMTPYFSEEFGNPGSLHSFGQKAIAAVDSAREKIGALIHAPHFRDIIFTASATEANNLALRSVVSAYKKEYGDSVPRMIVSSIEHESILETASSLAKEGVEVVCLPVDKEGLIKLDLLKDTLNDRTAIVSVMYVNNEVGTIQPLMEIKAIIDGFKKTRNIVAGKTAREFPIFHTDAVQAFQFLDCDVRLLGVDIMTLSAHKIYGPKGIGALYVRHDGIALESEVTGGGQEFGIRSGTENVPSIVGFSKAAELAVAAREKEFERIAKLNGKLLKRLMAIAPDAKVNGTGSALGAPHILNIYFPGNAAQDMLTKFDRDGLAVSSGSACRSRAAESSYVIEAMGYSRERAASSIRFSLGRTTTEEDIEAAAKVVETFFGKSS